MIQGRIGCFFDTNRFDGPIRQCENSDLVCLRQRPVEGAGVSRNFCGLNADTKIVFVSDSVKGCCVITLVIQCDFRQGCGLFHIINTLARCV